MKVKISGSKEAVSEILKLLDPKFVLFAGKCHEDHYEIEYDGERILKCENLGLTKAGTLDGCGCNRGILR